MTDARLAGYREVARELNAISETLNSYLDADISPAFDSAEFAALARTLSRLSDNMLAQLHLFQVRLEVIETHGNIVYVGTPQAATDGAVSNKTRVDDMEGD